MPIALLQAKWKNWAMASHGTKIKGRQEKDQLKVQLHIVITFRQTDLLKCRHSKRKLSSILILKKLFFYEKIPEENAPLILVPPLNLWWMNALLVLGIRGFNLHTLSQFGKPSWLAGNRGACLYENLMSNNFVKIAVLRKKKWNWCKLRFHPHGFDWKRF